MRRVLFGFCLLAMSACAGQEPDRSYPVFFTPFSSQLDAPASAIVANAAAVAKRYPDAAVRVVGFADPVSGPVDNGALSQARANVVSTELIRDGVSGSRVITKAAGVPSDSQPGVKDRRAEIDIDLP